MAECYNNRLNQLQHE